MNMDEPRKNPENFTERKAAVFVRFDKKKKIKKFSGNRVDRRGEFQYNNFCRLTSAAHRGA